MNTSSARILSAVLLAALAGCASNPIVGHGASAAGRYNGEVGVSGNGSTLTIQSGSNVSKLSIIGDACKVTVDEGAQVGKIEFWGNSSTVSIPENLTVSIAAMGNNQVIRRPAGSEANSKPGSASRPMAP